MDPTTLAMWESWARGGREAVRPFVERRNFEADRALERTQELEDLARNEAVERARIGAITDRTELERMRIRAARRQQQEEWRREDAEFKRKSEDWNRVFDLNQDTLNKGQAHVAKLTDKFAAELDARAVRAANAALTPDQAQKMAELRKKFDDPDLKNELMQMAAEHPGSGFDPNNPDPETFFRVASIDKEKYQAAYQAYWTTLAAQREANEAAMFDEDMWPEELLYAKRNLHAQKTALAGLYDTAARQDARYVSGRPMLDVVMAAPTLDEEAAAAKVAREQNWDFGNEMTPGTPTVPQGSGGLDLDSIDTPVPRVDEALTQPLAPAASVVGLSQRLMGADPISVMSDEITDATSDLSTTASGMASIPQAVWSGDPEARQAVKEGLRTAPAAALTIPRILTAFPRRVISGVADRMFQSEPFGAAPLPTLDLSPTSGSRTPDHLPLLRKSPRG